MTVNLKNYWSAIITFEKALEKATFIRNEAAQDAIIIVSGLLQRGEKLGAAPGSQMELSSGVL